MDPTELLDRVRTAVSWETSRDGTASSLSIIENAGEMAAAFEALDEWLTNGGALPSPWDRPGVLPSLGKADPEVPDPRRCRSCGTPSAECDAIYERTETTTGDLCCRLCEVGDTSAIHDPALPALPAAIDGKDVVDFQDEGNGEVTLDLADGSVFSFRIPGVPPEEEEYDHSRAKEDARAATLVDLTAREES